MPCQMQDNLSNCEMPCQSQDALSNARRLVKLLDDLSKSASSASTIVEPLGNVEYADEQFILAVSVNNSKARLSLDFNGFRGRV